MADGELVLEVGEGIELVGSIKLLVVLAVAALDLAIVPWSIGADQLVPDAELGKGILKESGARFLSGSETIGEL